MTTGKHVTIPQRPPNQFETVPASRLEVAGFSKRKTAQHCLQSRPQTSASVATTPATTTCARY